jgi:hypothetical protein
MEVGVQKVQTHWSMFIYLCMYPLEYTRYQRYVIRTTILVNADLSVARHGPPGEEFKVRCLVYSAFIFQE